MKTILRELIEAAPLKVELNFGINTNVVFRSLDIEDRMYQGALISRNTFMRFTEVHPVTRKPTKEKEYSFFNLDSNSDYVVSNMQAKMTKMSVISACYGVTAEELEEAIEIYLTKRGVSEEDELEKVVTTVKGAAAIDKALSEGFKSVINDKIGVDSTLLRLKTVSDKRGYLELPRFGNFIEVMEGEGKTGLRVTMKEFQTRDEASKPKTSSADKIGVGMKSSGGKLDMKNLGI